ncbi:MAG TPA: bifunctional diguanylate cyclase/phosphodiesterase [Streptosporangiaceae bacterium]|nr:bifunctional diguanylate cyclase/phosphodiesterase [Streptosporangiaceae bacterium]
MSPATLAWSIAWILLTAGASARLWRLASPPEPFVKDGYRWLAVAVLCFGVGRVGQQAFGGALGGAPPLRLADLISLAGLPALVFGIATLTTDQADPGRSKAVPGRWRFGLHNVVSSWPPTRGQIIDGALLAVSLFWIGLLTMFGHDYVSSGAGQAGFALDLIRPVADLATLGLVCLLIPRNPKLTLLPVLAVAAVAVADSLAVGSRAAGMSPGVGSELALAVALGLLAAVPAPPQASVAGPAGRAGRAGSGSEPVLAWSAYIRLAGPVAAFVAALLTAAFALFGHVAAMRAVAVTGLVVVTLLVIRLAWFTSQAVTVTASAHAFDWAFASLAGSSSDTVLICDAGGIIQYVSPAIGEFGYEPDAVAGVCLGDVVHPEDRSAGVRAATAALHGEAGTATFSGRVRAADGTWRRVSAKLSRFGQAGEPGRLLIACHDDSELAALRWQLAQVTFHDGVTGLPNRAYLEDRVRELTQAPGQRDADGAATVAAVLVWLDGGVTPADLGWRHGESVVLLQAGRRLRAAAPHEAVVARWGSEQFAVLIGDLGEDDGAFDGQATGAQARTQAQAAEIAARLADAIVGEPFSVDGQEAWLTASVGVATGPVAEADQVLGHAHAAMLKASQAGGGRVELFCAPMRAQATRRAQLGATLSEALTGHQLQIDYHPVVELATGRVTSVEAVVSWTLDGERIGADELMAAAQDFGLVNRVGDWLLAQACAQVAGWRASGAMLGLMVALSGRQLAVPGFAGSVLTALDEAGLPPQALTLCFAEQVLLELPGSGRGDLAELRAAGVRIAISNFGTGHASLSYLRRLVVDIMTIDGSFTAGLGTDPTLTLLMPAIIDLGRDLGIEMIATGIERPDQAELLMKMGCALGTGAFLGRPLPAGAVDPIAAERAAFWSASGPASDAGPGSDSGPSGQPAPDQAGAPACSPAS